jgi:Family of unknown function (DUF6998)
MKPPRITNRQRLEAIAVRPVPCPFGDKLRAITTIVGEMRADARNIGVNRQFTPDGRFLGDIGEVIGKICFGVNLHPTQQEGEDGTCRLSGKCVEVKLRSKSTLVYVSKIPEFLIAIYLSPITLNWGIVCNGPGKDLLHSAKWTGQRYETDLIKLMAAQASLPEDAEQVPDSEIPTLLITNHDACPS